MKAERRHELQTNTLAQFISDLPYYVRFHANKLLVGVMVICALIILYRYRSNASAQRWQDAIGSLATARNTVDQLQMSDRLRNDTVGRAQDRRRAEAQVNADVDKVLENTKDPRDAVQRAGALIARGDLNWVLANLPALPGATTQPVLALPESQSEYLDNAEGAYQQVLKLYGSQMLPEATALLGLAAIEENRGNWDKAIGYYNQLITDPSMASTFKEVARRRIAMIPQLRIPVYLGSYPSTQPTTAPATKPSH